MVEAMVGADVAGLRSLAGLFDRSADSLARSMGLLTSSVASAGQWTGPDANRFRSSWASSCRPALTRAIGDLHQAAVTARTNADEQERVSSGTGGGASGAGGLGGLAAGALFNRDTALIAQRAAALGAIVGALFLVGATRGSGGAGESAKGTHGGSRDSTTIKGAVSQKDDLHKQKLVDKHSAGDKRAEDAKKTDEGAKGPKKPEGTVTVGRKHEIFDHDAEHTTTRTGEMAGIRTSSTQTQSAEIGAKATAQAEASRTHVTVEAGVESSASASLKDSASFGVVHTATTATARAEVSAGVSGGLGVHNGAVEAYGDAKAGAVASVTESATVGAGGVDATGTGGLSAGLGADAGGGVHKVGDKYQVGFHLGASLGVGVKFGGSVSVDPTRVANAAKHMGHFASHLNPFH